MSEVINPQVQPLISEPENAHEATAELLKTYATELNKVSDAGSFPLEMYAFLGSTHDFEFTIMDYKHICIDLLKALSFPDISQSIMPWVTEYSTMLEMITRLHSLLCTMEQEQFRLQIQATEIENHWGNYSDKSLEELRKVYQTKLNVLPIIRSH